MDTIKELNEPLLGTNRTKIRDNYQKSVSIILKIPQKKSYPQINIQIIFPLDPRNLADSF